MFFSFKNHFKIIIFLFIILSGCKLQEPLKTHGIIYLENRSNKLTVSKSNKNDVLKCHREYNVSFFFSLNTLRKHITKHNNQIFTTTQRHFNLNVKILYAENGGTIVTTI